MLSCEILKYCKIIKSDETTFHKTKKKNKIHYKRQTYNYNTNQLFCKEYKKKNTYLFINPVPYI